MQLFSFGLNYQSAPVEIRERIAFPESGLTAALRALSEEGLADEGAILSTCNRTEIYCRTENPEAVVDWLCRFHQVSPEQLLPHLYQKFDEEAVAHAFRVASGMNSMVLGEAQILGQVKQAIRVAGEAGSLGWLLNKLFQQTFAVAKEVRTKTGIGAHSVSLAAAAIRMSTRVLGNVSQQNVLLVGAGEMMELVATHVAAHQPRSLCITNRTLERAVKLAERHGGTAIALTEMPNEMSKFDMVISCTASPLPIIGKGLMERVLRQRRYRPVVMIDLAVPRDIETEVAGLENVFLYTVDDLGKLIDEGREARHAAAKEAEALIAEQVGAFMHWLRNRELVPVIKQLRGHAESYRQLELERARKLLARGDEPEMVLEALSQGLMNKFLHHPTQLLQQASADEQPQLIQLLPRLFPVANEE
jgi:glutamyl-tRNA reductase